MRSAEERKEIAAAAFARLSNADTVTQEMLETALGAEIGPNMNKNYGSLILRHGLWDEAMNIAMQSEDKVAFRASWSLENAYELNKAAFVPYAGRLFADFVATENGSVQRTYSKMIYDITHRRLAVMGDPTAEAVAAKAFDLLLDPAVRVAAKVWCMEILLDLCPRIDWVAENLREAVEAVMQSEPSRGMVNRAKKILKRLDKNK